VGTASNKPRTRVPRITHHYSPIAGITVAEIPQEAAIFCYPDADLLPRVGAVGHEATFADDPDFRATLSGAGTTSVQSASNESSSSSTLVFADAGPGMLNQVVNISPFQAERFAFTLTSSSGERLFGFCVRFLEPAPTQTFKVRLGKLGLHSSGTRPFPTVLCLLTREPMFALFNELLHSLHIRWLVHPSSVFPLLQALTKPSLSSHALSSYPSQSHASRSLFRIRVDESDFMACMERAFRRMAPPGSTPMLRAAASPTVPSSEMASLLAKSLPLLPCFDLMVLPRLNAATARGDGVDVTPLFRHLTSVQIVRLYIALLLEKRIVVSSQSIGLLSQCVHALSSLIFPLRWQHAFVPLVPPHLVPVAAAPFPYLLGIRKAHLPELFALPLNETILVDLDMGRIHRITRPSRGASTDATVSIITDLADLPFPPVLGQKLTEAVRKVASSLNLSPNQGRTENNAVMSSPHYDASLAGAHTAYALGICRITIDGLYLPSTGYAFKDVISAASSNLNTSSAAVTSPPPSIDTNSLIQHATQALASAQRAKEPSPSAAVTSLAAATDLIGASASLSACFFAFIATIFSTFRWSHAIEAATQTAKQSKTSHNSLRAGASSTKIDLMSLLNPHAIDPKVREIIAFCEALRGSQHLEVLLQELVPRVARCLEERDPSTLATSLAAAATANATSPYYTTELAPYEQFIVDVATGPPSGSSNAFAGLFGNSNSSGGSNSFIPQGVEIIGGGYHIASYALVLKRLTQEESGGSSSLSPVSDSSVASTTLSDTMELALRITSGNDPKQLRPVSTAIAETCVPCMNAIDERLKAAVASLVNAQKQAHGSLRGPESVAEAQQDEWAAIASQPSASTQSAHNQSSLGASDFSSSSTSYLERSTSPEFDLFFRAGAKAGSTGATNLVVTLKSVKDEAEAKVVTHKRTSSALGLDLEDDDAFERAIREGESRAEQQNLEAAALANSLAEEDAIDAVVAREASRYGISGWLRVSSTGPAPSQDTEIPTLDVDAVARLCSRTFDARHVAGAIKPLIQRLSDAKGGSWLRVVQALHALEALLLFGSDKCVYLLARPELVRLYAHLAYGPNENKDRFAQRAVQLAARRLLGYFDNIYSLRARRRYPYALPSAAYFQIPEKASTQPTHDEFSLRASVVAREWDNHRTQLMFEDSATSFIPDFMNLHQTLHSMYMHQTQQHQVIVAGQAPPPIPPRQARAPPAPSPAAPSPAIPNTMETRARQQQPVGFVTLATSQEPEDDPFIAIASK